MRFYENFDACLVNVIDSIKQLLYSRHDDIFERLDFDNDEIYLEPLLYTYVMQQDNKWLDSIIYGYEVNKKEKIEVFSNSGGVIYLPKVGYFKTAKPNETFVLETINNEIRLELNGQKAEYSFEPVLYLAYNVEVVKHQHPLLLSVFTEQGTSESDLEIEDVYKTHIENFNRGLDIIKASNPDYFEMLQKNLKKVMLYSSEKQNSFAVMAAHNMIFLNVNVWDNEIFFVDHISHEGGHVIFNTLTYESKYDMFKCHPNTSFAEASGHDWEHGTVYLSFHALFSYMAITTCLEKCLNNKDLPDKLLHEVNGRMAFHLEKFKLALQSFERLDIFKAKGLEWFEIFLKHYNRLKIKYQESIMRYTLNKQLYDFSSKIFEEQNPWITEKFHINS